MRLIFASLAALAAFAVAAPAVAQQEIQGTPTPVVKSKPKPGTTAYCNTLKSATSRDACLKRVHAQAPTATKNKTKTKAKAKAPKKGDPAPVRPGDTAEVYTAPASAAAPQIVIVPPLPQKTI